MHAISCYIGPCYNAILTVVPKALFKENVVNHTDRFNWFDDLIQYKLSKVFPVFNYMYKYKYSMQKTMWSISACGTSQLNDQ